MRGGATPGSAQRLFDAGRSFVPTENLLPAESAQPARRNAVEDLPDLNNRVRVEDGEIQLHYTANNTEPHERLKGKLKATLGDTGCRDRLIPCSFYLGKDIPLAGVAH